MDHYGFQFGDFPWLKLKRWVGKFENEYRKFNIADKQFHAEMEVHAMRWEGEREERERERQIGTKKRDREEREREDTGTEKKEENTKRRKVQIK